jgi:hypothetical protein
VTAGSGLRLLPQAFEPMPGNTGVTSGVLGISVTEVVPHGAQVGALIGQVVAAGAAEHVRPDAPELCGLASDPHDIIDGLVGELCLPLGHEQPGQIVLPGGEVALDGAEFVAGDRVLDAQAALETRDPQPGTLVELVAPHLDGLADPQAVPVDHEQKGVVANAVAALLCRLKQAIDLRTVQKILRALVRVGRSRLTLYLSPVGRLRHDPRKCLNYHYQHNSALYTSLQISKVCLAG